MQGINLLVKWTDKGWRFSRFEGFANAAGTKSMPTNWDHSWDVEF